MFNSILKLAFILCFLSVSQARTLEKVCQLKNTSYDGAYMGLNLGVDYSQNKVVSTHSSFYHKSHVGFNGGFGGLLLGYGTTTNDVYAGTEFSLNLVNSKGGATSHSVDTHYQVHTLYHTIKKENDIAASLRVGKILDNRFLVYTKFQGGIEKLSFLYKLDNGLDNTHKRISRKLPHVKLGVGADWRISEKIALGVAYDYKIPKNITHQFDGIKNKHSLDTSLVSFRAMYYF